MREAVEASKEGFELWKAKTAKERAYIVNKWGSLIDENQESLAKVQNYIQDDNCFMFVVNNAGRRKADFRE